MLLIRRFTDADVALGMRLKEQVGWNQLEADWRRMHQMQPDGGFVAEYEGEPSGTVMTCIFGDVAWVAMMLVEPLLRGKGIGRALMEHALSFLDGRGIRSIRLDATPLGQPLYEKLGFVAEYSLARCAGCPSGSGAVAGVMPAAEAEYESIISLDRLVTQTDRRKLLACLLAERPAFVARQSGELCGYLLSRAGANATQIGPCIANEIAGPLLLHQAFTQFSGRPIYIDIPILHSAAAALAREQGLTVQRQLLRMCRGPHLHEGVDRLWASSGPELG